MPARAGSGATGRGRKTRCRSSVHSSATWAPASRWLHSHCWHSCRLAVDQAWGRRRERACACTISWSWIGEQYGVHYAENTRESPAPGCHCADDAGRYARAQHRINLNCRPTTPRNHYAIHASVLEKIKQLEKIWRHRARKQSYQSPFKLGHAHSVVSQLFSRKEKRQVLYLFQKKENAS